MLKKQFTLLLAGIYCISVNIIADSSYSQYLLSGRDIIKKDPLKELFTQSDIQLYPELSSIDENSSEDQIAEFLNEKILKNPEFIRDILQLDVSLSSTDFSLLSDKEKFECIYMGRNWLIESYPDAISQIKGMKNEKK